MAKKLEVFYLRDLKKSPLNIESLKNIIDISPSIRLNWGKEYIDFNFTYPVESDLEVEKVLQIFEGGKIPIGLYPTGGSYSLLGRGVSENSIDIKTYSLQEFCELSKKSGELVAMSVPFSKPTSSNYHRFLLFDEVKVRDYYDYSWIITDLEENGYVSTYPSENILRTDERRFKLKPKAETVNPELRQYIGQSFEVDSLGTSFYPELTKGIIFLSSRYFKDTSTGKQIPCQG